MLGGAAADMPNFETVKITQPVQGVACLAMDRPAHRNALSRQMLGELAGALQVLEADRTVRCVLLTGGDKAFASGADLKEMAAFDYVAAITDSRRPFWYSIRHFAKPLIAVVRGWALGGGFELALSCDLIVAGSSARFGLPEINAGIMPAGGGTQLLTRAIGKSRALQLIMTGDPIAATEAQALGLVAQMHPDESAMSEAVALAARIATKPPLALRMAKEAVLHSFEMGLESGIDYEFRAARQLWPTKDKEEGFAAFLERRTPDFGGR